MPHISYSVLKNWDHCPFYHKLVYLDKVTKFQGNEYTAFGNAIHDVCEKKLLKEEVDAESFFIEEFKKCLKELESKSVEFNIENVKKMVPQGVAILPEIEPALKEYFEDFEVFSTEELLMVPIEGTGYNFKGYIDAVIKVGDTYHIVDWKSCSWGWNAKRRSEPITTYQLTLYKKFFCQKHNIDPKNVETHFALLKRTAKENRVEIFRVTSGERKTENALKLLEKALYNIAKGKHIKNRLSCYRCDLHKTKHCP